MNTLTTQTIPPTWSQHFSALLAPEHLKSVARSALKVIGAIAAYAGYASHSEVATTSGVVSVLAGMFMSWLNSTPVTTTTIQTVTTANSPGVTVTQTPGVPLPPNSNFIPPGAGGNATGLTSGPVVAFALLFALLFFGGTGCKSTTTTTNLVSTNSLGVVTTNAIVTTNTTLFGVVVTPMGVYTTLRGGTASAARIALNADTNSLAYLQAVRQVLGDALGSTNYNSATLLAAVNAIPNTSVKNTTAIAAINAGFAAFEILEPVLKAQVNGQNAFVIPALQGLYDGIGDALGIVAPTPVFANDLKDAIEIPYASIFIKPAPVSWVLDAHGQLCGFLAPTMLPVNSNLLNGVSDMASK